eukprot:1745851-Prymnesium_polylepis.1
MGKHLRVSALNTGLVRVNPFPLPGIAVKWRRSVSSARAPELPPQGLNLHSGVSCWGLRGCECEKIGCCTPTFLLFRAVAHFVPPGSEATRA